MSCNVSIPKRVLEALNPLVYIYDELRQYVSIPKRVLEALNHKISQLGKRIGGFQSLKGF